MTRNHMIFFVFLLSTFFGCKSYRSTSSGVSEDETTGTILPVTSGPGSITISNREAAFIREISSSGIVFKNPVFWDYYEANSDLALALLNGEWLTGLPKDEILQAAYSLGKYFILYLDLGIAIRAEEFRQFASNKISANPNISPFELRTAFSDSLPKASVWRGILLTPSEAQIVKNTGIKASGFYQSEERQNAFLAGEYLDKNVWSVHPSGPYDDLSRRLNGMTKQSIYASYSEWIEVTYAGCWLPPLQGGSLLRNKPGIQFHLFRVEVSELDLIRPNGMLNKLISDKQGQIYKTTGINGQPWEKSFGDEKFEMFIQYVAPDEIKESTVYDQFPPKWGT